MKKIFTILFILFSLVSFSQSTTVVISQVYPGGGSTSPTVTYKKDYVELHNISGVTQNIGGFSLQYGSATGNFGASATQIFAFPAGTSIPAGRYLLVELGTAGTGGADLPVTADFSSTNLSMGAASGKVALVNNTTGVGCGATATPCSIPAAAFIDVVSYGASNNAEGGVPVNNNVALPANTNGAVRKNNGCTETDNNNADFDVVVAPVPRNSASAAFACGATATITTTALTAFGNVCTGTVAGPNTFTINGTNLSAANVTVGALTGYTYATASGGPYTASLSLTQPGGTYSQQIFVRFSPTLVQSYNGNIPVAGGGIAAPVNVAASGAGVNSIPSVTTVAASGVTSNAATGNGTISSIGCSLISAYGIEYSTTNGFPNGTGTQVPSSNLSGGNFSSVLSPLAPSTTYYFHAWATNAAGTAYGVQLSFTTANPNPAFTATALAPFGNVCTGTTAGPNSFTITGSNLTNANVSVGPLTGYTFSTTSGGTYTASLSLAQPGGTYSQQIFVRFSPTLVQSYNGNIPLSGGGVAATVNVPASGAGVNSSPTVTTGAASAITQISATAAGSIPGTGCSAVTAYGIEYSTTNNFPVGTGTQVASTNLSAGNFTSALAGLTSNTTYYYRAYATNAGGTAYGAQMSFTTLPPVLTATALTGFGNICIGTTSAENSFTITGVGVTAANITVGPLAGFTFATTAAGPYSASLNLTHSAGAYSQVIYVKFSPTLVQSYNGNIPVGGGGAATINVAVSGSGVNTTPTVVTGSATNITTTTATLGGSVTDNGCSAVTQLGIEYSGINGFLPGNGTKVPAAGGGVGPSFFSNLTGLVQGAVYYYRAYAVNGGGIAYGPQQSFGVTAIGHGFTIYPNPATRGGNVRITVDSLKAGYYGLLIYDAAGRLVFQKNMNIQVEFINQVFTLPANLQHGLYRFYLVNFEETIGIRTILIQ